MTTDTADSIAEALRALVAPGDVFEVRVLDAARATWRRPHTESGWFDNPAAASEAVRQLHGYGGAYFTLSPVNPDLMARAKNRLIESRKGQATTDADILRRRWLFVDIDPVRPSGISATDAEKTAAETKAVEISQVLTVAGWPAPAVVDSGNGFYLLYRVDLPADDGGLSARVLQALAFFSDDRVHVDTAVHNAARIVRIPGTWNRKGEDLPERPHRLARLLDVGDGQIVTREQLEALVAPSPDCATNRSVSVPVHGPLRQRQETAGCLRPGDDFNERGQIGDVLAAAGWALISDNGKDQAWRRPGKEGGRLSATYSREHKVFYVFSSNAQPFEANKGYSHFQVLAILAHSGDYSAASGALADQGFGYTPPPGYDDGLDDFIAKHAGDASATGCATERSANVTAREPSRQRQEPGERLPDRFLDVPGFIGDVIRHNLETAPKPQPVLALAGAIALQAILCARKLTDERGTRPNIYICGVAESGAGKDHSRAINRRVLQEANLSNLHAEGIKSGSALVNALVVHPAILFQIDEYGRFLRSSNTKMSNPYAQEIVSNLLRLYTTSRGRFESDRYADTDKGGKTIDRPHAILYGTTVPASLYEGLTYESISDGFLARTLLFDVGGNDPERRLVSPSPLPMSVLATAKWWGELKPEGSGNMDVTEMVATITPEAWDRARAFIATENAERTGADGYATRALWARAGENADKLALIYAASRAPEKLPVVDAAAAEWGYGLSEWLTRHTCRIATENIASTIFHATALAVMKAIREEGGSATRARLSRKTRLRKKDLDETLDHLMEAGDIRRSSGESTDAGGRKAEKYAISV